MLINMRWNLKRDIFEQQNDEFSAGNSYTHTYTPKEPINLDSLIPCQLRRKTTAECIFTMTVKYLWVFVFKIFPIFIRFSPRKPGIES